MTSADPPDGAHVTYSLQYRRCTRPGCPSCAAGGPGHGPYWYAYWRQGGRRRARYLGKQRPTGAQPASPAAIGECASPPVPATGTALRVRTLGGFALWRGEQPLPTARLGRDALHLLQCLLGAPFCRLHREQLLDALWPDAQPAAAAARLRRTLHTVRALIDVPRAPASYLRWEGDLLALVPRPGGDPPPDWLDAAAFAQHARPALAGRDLDACRAALALYGGEYLPEDPYAEWAAATRETLARRHLDLLLHLAVLCRERGEVAEAERCLREALAADPCHEGAAQALMALLASGGRRGEALRVYQRIAAALDRELGLGPQAALEGLRSRLLAEAATPAAPDHTPRTADRHGNLPAPVSSFVGRAWERGELRTLLGEARLLTLTGPGGVGKSRLAREVARDLPDLYPDGVWQVELAAAANPALVPGAVAAALGVAEQPGRPLLDTLAEALRDRDVLLLLDNCEHLLAACADLAEALLARCPRLRILATGRQALGLAGEVAWLVPPLAFPGHEAAPSPVALAGYEAVQLFLARARAHRPAFSLTESNAVAVATVCVRLDGIPLALELAAARLGALSVAEVAARLGDRFALLAGETRAARPRQQTLRATIDWSWDLLAETERVLLRRLAVFAGGWTLGAAEAICGDDGLSPVSRDAVLDLLSALVAKSLVQASERDGRSRYSMLETVRHYAQERLAGAGEAIRLLDSHLAWCVALAEEADRHLTGPRQADWLERLETEHDNLRAALGWASEQRAGEEGLQLAGALSRFWKLRGHLSEGRGWLERLLAGDDQCSAPVRARALNGAGTLAHRQSDYGRATELYEQALALARALGDRARIARALGNLGLVARDQSAFGRATALFEEAMALLRESGDEQGVAISLGNLGAVAFHQGAYCRATAFCEEALALNRALGDRWGIAHALGDLGLVAYQRVEYGRAEALHAESLALRREIGDKQGITYSLNHLGLVAYQLGEYGRAEALHAEALTLLRELGHRQGLAYTLNCLGSVASRQGDLVRAAALHEEALVLWREQGDHWGIATSLHSLGLLAHARGDLGQAVASHLDSLRLSRDIGAKNLLAEVLESLVWALGARGETRQAARLGGAVQALRDVLGVPLQADKLAGRERALAAMRAALGEAELATAWADGAALSPEQAVSEALPAGA